MARGARPRIGRQVARLCDGGEIGPALKKGPDQVLSSLLSRGLALPGALPLARKLCGRSRTFRRLVWDRLALDAELRFQRGAGNEWRTSPAFLDQTRALFEGWGFDAGQYDDQVLVDLGAGPRLRSAWFTGARIHAVEPLAEEYRSLDCCDYAVAEGVHAGPAEEVVPCLAGKAALVICLNVLDHVYDPAAVIRAAAGYLAPEGRFLLSTDLHEADPPGHPVALDEPLVRRWCEQAGLEPEWARVGLGEHGQGYGGEEGETAITLLLRRSGTGRG